VHPPGTSKTAFDDVVKAREDAKTFINEAKNMLTRNTLQKAMH
jgi:hypothetical protein